MHEPLLMQSCQRKRQRPGVPKDGEGIERTEAQDMRKRLNTQIFKEERYFTLHLGDLGHPRQPFDIKPLGIQELRL